MQSKQASHHGKWLSQTLLVIWWTFVQLALLASAQDDVAAPEIPLTATTLFAPFKYHHHAYLDSNDSFSSLEFLAAYEFGRNGTFEVTLDFSLSLNSSREDVDGRVLFYLLVCDEPATAAIADITALYTPPIVYTTGKPAKTVIIEVTAEGTHPNMHCAMPNRTLDYYCKSFPVDNQSPGNGTYQSTKTISGLVDNITSQTAFSKVGGLYSNTLTKLSFYIDACELLGANQSILRSCMEYPPPLADNYYLATGNKIPCFFCPENYPNRSEAEHERWSRECIMSPYMQREIKGTVSMNLCTARGECFRQPNSALSWFYFSMIILWSLLCLVWMAQMVCAPSDTVLDLHRKIALVPVIQVIYTSFAYAAQQTAGMYLDWQRGILPTIAMAFQLVAFVVTLETLLYLAKGWNITLRKLTFRESSAIRVVLVAWVTMFIVVNELLVDHLALVIVSSLLWTGIVTMTYRWTDKNFSMYNRRMRHARRHLLDMAPFEAKKQIFREFRWILWGYMGISPLASLIEPNLFHDGFMWRFPATFTFQVLTYCLFVALFYLLRCRRFFFGSFSYVDFDPEAIEAIEAQLREEEQLINQRKYRQITSVAIINTDNKMLLGTNFSPQTRARNGKLASIVPVNNVEVRG